MQILSAISSVVVHIADCHATYYKLSLNVPSKLLFCELVITAGFVRRDKKYKKWMDEWMDAEKNLQKVHPNV